MKWLVPVVKCDPYSCNLGCGALETVQSVSLPAAGLNQAEAVLANNGGLQSQGQLLGLDGENFQVWQLLL